MYVRKYGLTNKDPGTLNNQDSTESQRLNYDQGTPRGLPYKTSLNEGK